MGPDKDHHARQTAIPVDNGKDTRILAVWTSEVAPSANPWRVCHLLMASPFRFGSVGRLYQPLITTLLEHQGRCDEKAIPAAILALSAYQFSAVLSVLVRAKTAEPELEEAA